MSGPGPLQGCHHPHPAETCAGKRHLAQRVRNRGSERAALRGYSTAPTNSRFSATRNNHQQHLLERRNIPELILSCSLIRGCHTEKTLIIPTLPTLFKTKKTNCNTRLLFHQHHHSPAAQQSTTSAGSSVASGRSGCGLKEMYLPLFPLRWSRIASAAAETSRLLQSARKGQRQNQDPPQTSHTGETKGSESFT